jgi:hypothetical protein
VAGNRGDIERRVARAAEAALAKHPLLLQLACFHLFNARVASSARSAGATYDDVKSRYLEEATAVYRYYVAHEFTEADSAWLADVRSAHAEGRDDLLEDLTRDTPHRKNRTICAKLRRLGLVLDDATPLSIADGFEAFVSSGPGLTRWSGGCRS